MNTFVNNSVQQFKNQVGLKYEMYNSLFTSLPFQKVENTGVLLSLFLLHCEEGFRKEKSPAEIINSFSEQFTSLPGEQEQLDLLFRFVQYAERQVVLFDALEDAAFSQIHDMQGVGTLKHLQAQVLQTQEQDKLAEKLKDFSVRLVLTAHPTQFYPSTVLGIINDLSKALANNNPTLANTYLEQLGKTPFFKKEKPTPYDEAKNLIWFLENVFYQAGGQILSFMKNNFPSALNAQNPLIRMGFWPGGDRDGNPFVKAETTIKVAEALRCSILKNYYLDVRKLKRRLTFDGVDKLIAELEVKLYKNVFFTEHTPDLDKNELISTLQEIRKILIEQHNSLFLNQVDRLLTRVQLFGTYFASLDVRQDSSVHHELLDVIAANSDALPSDYTSLSADEKINILLNVDKVVDPSVAENEVQEDVLKSVSAIQTIQGVNGEEGVHRYIISHSTSPLDIIEVYGLFLLRGWKRENLSVDIVPLFETVEDLRNAAAVMKSLYKNEVYRKHLQQRGNVQTIMLGFSDGTKDGGYLMANFGIYKAKEELSIISKENGIEVIFFDGRGGPPARGGGKTHQFYASMGNNISNKEIQLTIQGQTVSSNFGTVDSAQFNIEQLMHAGISSALSLNKGTIMSESDEETFLQLSGASYDSYNELKNHPEFIEYLNFISPLRFYAETNIGSRPSKRKSGKLNLNDLRAVPYVGSWSQLKQNLPGYYGVGTALEKLEAAGKWDDVQGLYQRSLFFKTLLDNCEMAMKKCFFPLTAYLSEHPKYGELWKMMHEEFERTKKYVLKLTGADDLMADKPVDSFSIQMRQRIELPLVTIQQHALARIREIEEKDSESPLKKKYEKLVIRCSFGIINAERNSA